MAKSFEEYERDQSALGLYPPSPQHVFNLSRCFHCGCDDHSLPERGETLADWQKACTVEGDDRQTVWSFGPEATETDPTDSDLNDSPF